MNAQQIAELRESFIQDEMSNAVDAGCFETTEDPECRAYAERVWARQSKMRIREAGSTLTPVLAVLTALTVAAVLIAQSGLLSAVLARLAEVR